MYAIVAVLFFYSCKSQKNAAAANAQTSNDSLIISIQKFPCFGVCPYYEAKIYAGGYVWFEGKKHTDKIGVYETKISNNDINEIIEQAKSAGYFALPDSFYNDGIADYPVTITSVTQNGKRKRVYDGAPEATPQLQKFETYLNNFFLNSKLNWRLIRKPGGDE